MIALQNNPNLQAEFENIGIAQGDLINAGLFSNPQLELSVRVPNKGGFALNTDYTLTTSVLDFFLPDRSESLPPLTRARGLRLSSPCPTQTGLRSRKQL